MLDAKKVLGKIKSSVESKSEDISFIRDNDQLKERELWDKIKKSSIVANTLVVNGVTFKLAITRSVIKRLGMEGKSYVSLDKKYYIHSIKNEISVGDKPIVLNLRTFYPDGIMEFVSWV